MHYVNRVTKYLLRAWGCECQCASCNTRVPLLKKAITIISLYIFNNAMPDSFKEWGFRGNWYSNTRAAENTYVSIGELRNTCPISQEGSCQIMNSLDIFINDSVIQVFQCKSHISCECSTRTYDSRKCCLIGNWMELVSNYQ